MLDAESVGKTSKSSEVSCLHKAGFLLSSLIFKSNKVNTDIAI